MNKEDIIVGINGAHLEEGGRYNLLASYTQALLKAFRNNGVKAYSVKECVENNFPMNLTIGFNVFGYETWGAILSSNIPNIMWNLDSIFYNNMEAIEKYGTDPNFVLLSGTPCDQEAIANYFPDLKTAYLPFASGFDFEKNEICEKEFDIVYFSAMCDYEEKLVELSHKVQPEFFSLMLDIYDMAFNNPKLSFWQVTEIIAKNKGVEFDKNQYNFIFHNLAYVIDHGRRVQLVQSLSKFNLKLYGSVEWKKYISGNIEYMGEADAKESLEIINKSKIVVHWHPMQLCLGLSDRVLNASAAGTFVLSCDTASTKSIFGESLGYYNRTTLEDIAEKVDYFLANDEERISKAKKARKIVEDNHTLTHRAGAILNMVGIQ